MSLCRLACMLLVCAMSCHLATAATTHYNPAHWMKDLKDVIYDKSLLDITIPGTHDSGAYQFNDTFSPLDSKTVEELIKLCLNFGIDLYTFIKNWSITQNTTIYEQLNGGIRYIDLRANYINDTWYTEHFLIGAQTQELLNDIRKFMLENDGEIVVVELGNLDPASDELSLVKMITVTLGKWLAPPMNLNRTTIREMVAKDHRIVLLYPMTNLTMNNTMLWNKWNVIEGSYANMDTVPAMEAWNVQEINTYGGNDKIFELSWTLTTQDDDIIKTLLDPFLRQRTLKDFALEANGALDAWAQKNHNYQLGNILLLDFWEFSNVVNLTISFNLRQCQDNPTWVAIDPSGLYCRYFFLKGECTNPRYAAWMKENCRLSCGVC